INGNNSLRYLEFREGAFDFQTSQQNQYYRQFRDIPTLMKILNHSSQAVTIRYIGLEEEIRASLDKFNPLD
ncbi:hypothetical protein P7D31_13340, partial [Enterococcus dongliensis]|nr:hypothetical protein [Enterococcus dongliensis]